MIKEQTQYEAILNKKNNKIAFCLVSCLVIVSTAIVSHAFQPHSGTLMIDPGHSHNSPGAISCTGKPEYLYNSSLAEQVVVTFNKQHIPVTLTRQKMEIPSLQERALAAKGKNLFLSLHHDSVQPQFMIWDKKGRPCSAKAQGYSIFISRKNAFYPQSLAYASKLGTALLRRGLTPTLHHSEKIAGENRQLIDSKRGIYLFDNLYVLRKSDAPAVLLEAAVIVNPRDEAKAASKAYRKRIADAILEMMVSTNTKS